MISAISSALASTHLGATLARLDIGSTGSAKLRVYSTAISPGPGAHSDTPMCVVVLPRPCGVLSGAQLTLASAEAALVMVSGTPRWVELVAADDVVLHIGDVTDAAHDGFYKAAGAATPDGDNSPFFLAGGILSLGEIVLT